MIFGTQNNKETPMKIAKVTGWLLRVPYTLPLVKEQQHALANFVEVETDDGVKGHALATYPLRHSIREYINREAASAIIGMDPLRGEEIRTRLRASASKHYSGMWSCAASLIDIALWDIKGKALQQPIWKLLGGARGELPAYITFGFHYYTLAELVEAARLQVNDGQIGLKMVVGGGSSLHDDVRGPPTDASIVEDATRVAAVREAVGPKIEIMIDANSATTLAQALKLAKLCEPYNLTWFEDAVLQNDPLLLAKLRLQTTVPLAAGSSGTSDLRHLREYLIHEAVDYLQPNVRDIGGYTQGIKAAGMAQAFNVPLGQGGNYPHLNMHLHAAVPNGGRLEFHLQGWRCYEAVYDGTPSPVNGRVTLPTAPGLGFTPKSGILDLAVD